MFQGENQLTEEKLALLKQGSKVEFMYYGNSKHLFTGYIEVNKYGTLFFVNEHHYSKDGKLLEESEGMRYYNRLEDFYFFKHFNIITA